MPVTKVTKTVFRRVVFPFKDFTAKYKGSDDIKNTNKVSNIWINAMIN